MTSSQSCASSVLRPGHRRTGPVARPGWTRCRRTGHRAGPPCGARAWSSRDPARGEAGGGSHQRVPLAGFDVVEAPGPAYEAVRVEGPDRLIRTGRDIHEDEPAARAEQPEAFVEERPAALVAEVEGGLQAVHSVERAIRQRHLRCPPRQSRGVGDGETHAGKAAEAATSLVDLRGLDVHPQRPAPGGAQPRRRVAATASGVQDELSGPGVQQRQRPADQTALKGHRPGQGRERQGGRREVADVGQAVPAEVPQHPEEHTVVAVRTREVPAVVHPASSASRGHRYRTHCPCHRPDLRLH
ncbi:hypothetical protein SVIOM74S_00721 [Streptomyces violarus]